MYAALNFIMEERWSINESFKSDSFVFSVCISRGKIRIKYQFGPHSEY